MQHNALILHSSLVILHLLLCLDALSSLAAFHPFRRRR